MTNRERETVIRGLNKATEQLERTQHTTAGRKLSQGWHHEVNTIKSNIMRIVSQLEREIT